MLENSNVTHFFQASFINRVWSNKLCFWYQLFHAEIWCQSFWIIVCVLKRTIHKIRHNDVKNDLPIIEFFNFCQIVQILYFDLTFCWPGDWNPKLNWPLTHWSQKPNWWYILSGLKMSPSFCKNLILYFLISELSHFCAKTALTRSKLNNNTCCTAMRILERLGIQTSSSFVKIW